MTSLFAFELKPINCKLSYYTAHVSNNLTCIVLQKNHFFTQVHSETTFAIILLPIYTKYIIMIPVSKNLAFF